VDNNSVLYFGPDPGHGDERVAYWLANPPAAFAFDVETVDLKERMPVGLGIAFSPDEAIYIPLHPEPRYKALEAVAPLFQNGMIKKIAHNILFDLKTFPLIDIIGKKIDRYNIFDTSVASRYLGYKFTALDILALGMYQFQHETIQQMWKRLGVANNLELITKYGNDPIGKKCSEDTMLAYRLYLDWKDEINSKYSNDFQADMSVIPILIDMSLCGIALDTESVDGLIYKYNLEVEELYEKIKSYGIENPNSTQQVGYMLGKRGNFLKFTRSKKQYSTNNDELEFVNDELARDVLAYRHKNTFYTRYLLPIQSKDRFYTEYYLDTDVGRTNSRSMNIQNIPGADISKGDPGARFIMLPDYGLWVNGDFSKMHMYILAQMSGDPVMLKILYDPDREKSDIHQQTANLMGCSRKEAKVVNYAVIYGGTEKTLMESLKSKDRARCSHLLNRWFDAYRVASNWIKYAKQIGLKDGWSLPTLFGRRIKIPEEYDWRGQRNLDAMERKSVNYPILGSDGEVQKRSIIFVTRRGLGPPTLKIQVHDSMSFDGEVEGKLVSIKDELENLAGYRIPFEIKSTLRWE
jgi:DNA polymerase I-like protein with 3'-5' exonuclease and polymerase domains